MKAQRWAMIDSLYHAALTKEPGERSSFLAAVCAEDAELRREVESLLAHAGAHFSIPRQRSNIAKLARNIAGDGVSDAGGFRQAMDDGECGRICPQCNRWFGNGVDHCSSDGFGLVEAPPARIALTLPVAIGRYRIVRLLGQGGMGAVYEAEQEHPRRTVALKVIQPGLANPELLWRFEQESQALGRLQHPGIAQIYEAGTADTGFGPQPYFAMEFVRGESLGEYAEAHQLNTRQRLAMMTKICEAVRHAHQRGLIHRDLKPGNILVDETGQPRILDFGVVHMTGGDAQTTRQTNLGQIVGTLAYMSPEQVLGDPGELDVRSDVYSLGVILYELLAGLLPLNISQKVHEAVQTIREVDPAPLSSVRRSYRGDIETIVAKALEKDKARRYGSAADLAEDIRRYLRDEPIVARPPSASYQLQKFVRRHRGLVGGAAAVFVVLVCGIVVSTWQATLARRAELMALSESAAARAVNDFLQNDLLGQASASVQARPDRNPDPDLKVRTALDRAAARIADKFAAQPLVEGSIRQTIGNTYRDLGLFPDAQHQMERAFYLRRRVLGEVHPDTLTSMQKLAELYQDQGKYAEAEPFCIKVLAARRRMLGDGHPDTLMSMNNLAGLYLNEGKHAQAEPLLVKTLELRLRVLGEEHPDTLRTMNNLAVLYVYQSQYAKAEPLYTRVLDLKRRVLGEEHPSTLTGMNNLATLYGFQGKYEKAEALYTKALEVRRRVLGSEHPDTLEAIENLAVVYSTQRKYALAEPLFTEALEVQRRVLGKEHPDTLHTMNSMAELYRDQGRYAQAEPIFARVVDLRSRVLGEEHPNTLDTLEELAQLDEDLGKYAQAEPLYVRVLALRLRVLGQNHPDTASVLASLGRLRLKQQRFAEAEALFRTALNSLETATPDAWARYHTQSLLGVSLAAQKKYIEAEAPLLSGYAGMVQRRATIPPSSRRQLDQAGESIVKFFKDWGKPDEAETWTQNLRAAKLSVARDDP